MDTRHTPVQGTWVYSAAQLRENGVLKAGSQISLRREQNNKHDRNATAVFLGTSKLGYLPRALAVELATYLDVGGSYKGKISRVGTRSYRGKSYPSITIDLTLSDLQDKDGLDELFRSVSSLEGEQGVYQILNTRDGRKYIGSSENIGKRLLTHITQLRNGVHHNHLLAESWRIHGPQAFHVSVIERIKGPGMKERERFHIQRLETNKYGYNLTADGEGALPPPTEERRAGGLDRLRPLKPNLSPGPSPVTPLWPIQKTVNASKGCLVCILSCALITGITVCYFFV